ncbi:MAG: cell division protein ZipA [Psychrobium sp.]|nr:cell division protein ZipA [Psychrobium sp.]
MDFELRSVLLIVGVVVIAAILLHGLFSIRNANKPIDMSDIDLSEKDDNGDALRDRSGFDRHGVGVARVIDEGNDEGDKVATSSERSSVQPQINASAIDAAISGGPEMSMGADGAVLESSEQTDAINFDVALEHQVQPIVKAAVVFASPVAKEKQDFLNKNTKPATKPVPVVDTGIKKAKVSTSIASDPLDVLVLNVVASGDNELSGAQLLPILLTLGFKFGEMNIFHRHVDAAGQGDVLFSLANMVKPGVFDVDNMAQFSTTGVSLFMTLPHAHGNMETFNTMLNAAAKIAEEFSGQVLDGDRSTLTKQSTQHYVQRIKEVERKLLLIK